MQWTGKLIGSALGAFLGPVGIAVGAFLGHQYDRNAQGDPRLGVGQQFFRSTFLVMGHLAKADGRVTEREIDAARGIMDALKLAEVQKREAISLFSAGKRSDFDLDAELLGLRRSCGDHPSVLRAFIEIQLRFALAGSGMAGATRLRMVRIASQVGIPGPVLARLEAAMRGGRATGPAAEIDVAARTASAYRTLEVDADIADAELVKAYRRLMSRNHPDKMKANGLPDSMLEHAKQRTQEIRVAYEYLSERRGIT
ncbi:MAG: co-chaperone DjlA [Steroidobacteraceae bacterium]